MRFVEVVTPVPLVSPEESSPMNYAVCRAVASHLPYFLSLTDGVV